MKKVYIFLIIILLGFGLAMFLIYGVDTLKREKYKTVLIVGENTTWLYRNNAWVKPLKREAYDELNGKKYHVLENNKDIGTYKLMHNDKWYVYDDNKNTVNVDGVMVAYRTNYDITFKDFIKEDITDTTYVDEVLTTNSLPLDSEYTKSYKTSIDIDYDGIKEDFYVLSNVFPLKFQPKRIFSFVFMVKDEKIYYLYDDVRDYRVYAGCSPEIEAFVDADANNMDEIIVSCFQYSNLDRIDMLNRFDGEKFKILISSQ